MLGPRVGFRFLAEKRHFSLSFNSRPALRLRLSSLAEQARGMSLSAWLWPTGVRTSLFGRNFAALPFCRVDRTFSHGQAVHAQQHQFRQFGRSSPGGLIFCDDEARLPVGTLTLAKLAID